MVRGAGLEPAKALFPVLLASGAKGVSLPFIARRITNKTFYLQELFGNQWYLWAKKSVQFSCKISACAKTVQTQCRPEICANSVQTFLAEFATGDRVNSTGG
jgi:hypothetical protein